MAGRMEVDVEATGNGPCRLLCGEGDVLYDDAARRQAGKAGDAAPGATRARLIISKNLLASFMVLLRFVIRAKGVHVRCIDDLHTRTCRYSVGSMPTPSLGSSALNGERVKSSATLEGVPYLLLHRV